MSEMYGGVIVVSLPFANQILPVGVGRLRDGTIQHAVAFTDDYIARVWAGRVVDDFGVRWAKGDE